MSGPARGPDPAAALARALGGSVVALERLSGGASRTTWAFTHRHGGGERPLILQVGRPEAPATGPVPDEAALLAAAADAGVPVPAVVASGHDEGFGAPWVVTERLAGEAIPRKVLRDPEFAAARAVATEQCGRALAAVHTIDPRRVPGLAGGDQLARFGGLLAALEPVTGARPALELALRRLERTRPAVRTGSVVHGDFRTGNLLFGPDGLRAVLDWELAHLGDPLEDLGWFCVRAWRFGGPGRAGGFGSVAALCEAYRAAGGTGADPDTVGWWEAVGTFKWAVMCMVQVTPHLTGHTRSVELAAIGRRVCENEWDLLGLLGASPAPEEPPLEAEGDGGGAPFGRPTAAELLTAVGEYLRQDVVGGTAGRVGFHGRVAANVVDMVGRELQLGPAVARRHRRRLDRLGVADDADLARAVRAGTLDARWDEVAAAVAASVRDQLAVANPGHLEPGAPARGTG